MRLLCSISPVRSARNRRLAGVFAFLRGNTGLDEESHAEFFTGAQRRNSSHSLICSFLSSQIGTRCNRCKSSQIAIGLDSGRRS